jgi:hypothetical protein
MCSGAARWLVSFAETAEKRSERLENPADRSHPAACKAAGAIL